MNQIRIHFDLPRSAVAGVQSLVENLFEDDGYAVSAFEIDEDADLWAISIYLDAVCESEARQRLNRELSTIGRSPDIQVEILDDTNWVEKTLQDLAPVRAGRFVVHGSHDKGCASPHEHAVLIDAGMAFGTGHHGTTAGCLAMIDRELKRSAPRNALDLGSGTGVLAIAIAKAARIPVLASDIDPVADAVCRRNARINALAAYVESITATGFGHPRFSGPARFDLIVANILAGPLQALARDMAQHAAPGASVILSGLLPHQKARIVSAYRAQNLALEHAHYQDGWMTLVLKNLVCASEI